MSLTKKPKTTLTIFRFTIPSKYLDWSAGRWPLVTADTMHQFGTTSIQDFWKKRTRMWEFTLHSLFFSGLYYSRQLPIPSYTLKGDIFTPKTLLYSKQTRRGEKQQYWIHCGWKDLSGGRTQGKAAAKAAQKNGIRNYQWIEYWGSDCMMDGF